MAAYEELDYAITPMGELILRRREVLSLDRAEVYEVKLAGQFLMSSLVNDAEIALATRALSLTNHTECAVLVGGLGLGYTAKAALDCEGVESVTVIEYLDRVIDWYRRGLVPLAGALTDDPRCSLVHGDFFAAVGSPGPLPDQPEQPSAEALAETGSGCFDVILLDIDHSPQCLLHPAHAAFYCAKGLRRLTDHLRPGGVFGMWSADPPQPSLLDDLKQAFASVNVFELTFRNPLLSVDDVNYIITAQLADGAERVDKEASDARRIKERPDVLGISGGG